MSKSINYVSLTIALVGALKLILEPFGIEIPDNSADLIGNGVAAALTIGGIIYSHVKPKEAPIDAAISTSIESSK